MSHRFRTSDFGRYGRRYSREASPFVERARAYLRSRPTESWLFFAAGLMAGVILG